MKLHWKKIGGGLGGVLIGGVMGAVLGFVETHAIILAFEKPLGLQDQEGLIILAGAPFGAFHGAAVGLLAGLGVRNACGWALGAIVGLALWAPLFLRGTHQYSNVMLLLALTLPLWCGGVGAGLQARCTRGKKP